MILTRNVIAHVVADTATVRDALVKANKNKVRTLFVVDEAERLLGTLSSGDISKWLISQPSVDLSQSVVEACNRQFRSVSVGTPPAEIAKQFTDRIDTIPVIDAHAHLVALAFKGRPEVRIGEFSIGAGHPAFLIAEVGNNHNGSVELAKKLVDLAVEAGADCVKFQLRDLSALYEGAQEKDDKEDLGSQYVLDLLRRFNFEPAQMFEVFDYAKEKGILPLCTPWDRPSFEALEKYGVPAYKIASADLTNHELLADVAASGKPMLVSTGMSTETEILDTVRFLNEHSASFVLLHCNSTYPTPFKDVNLRYMKRLMDIGQVPVGYSGHERGHAIPVAAVALGATVVEKHFTVDRNMEGNDHKVSLLPDEFKAMVQAIRNTEEAMGVGNERAITQGELMNRETLAKSLVAAVDIAEGELITKQKIGVLSPGKGLQPSYKKQLIGRVARRAMPKGEFFYPSDLEDEHYAARPFQFSRPWGIPVRFHDFRELTSDVMPPFVEFHLSYRDMELDVSEYLPEKAELDFVVHAPELFAGDHVLDLASEDADYRALSEKNLQAVVDITRALAPRFPTTQRPMIVTNMGGFTADEPLAKADRAVLYDRIEESLSRIDASGVEILAQTMPPFPWHFGGQRYHNLFVDPDEIKEFCSRTQSRICLDLSHSKLACTHYGYRVSSFVEKVGPFTAHMHIVDAKGVDDEGLQIGEGEIDFQHFGELAKKHCPNAWFIPEIWQGHKNKGEGFWKALTRLEGLL